MSRIIKKIFKRNKEEFSKKNENSSENYEELHGEEKDLQVIMKMSKRNKKDFSKKDENFSENKEK